MLTLTSPQQAQVNATTKAIDHLFELTLAGGGTTLYYSTKAKTFGGHAYLFKIRPDSFQGIREVRARIETGSRTPTTTAFSVVYDGTEYDAVASAILGASLVIREIINNVEIKAWKFKVKVATFRLGELQIQAEDFLQEKLDGVFPHTKLISDLDPTFNGDKTACVPIPIGTAFMPLEMILNGGNRYYILGPYGGTYTVEEVRSPKEWNTKSQWTSPTYTMSIGALTIGGTAYATLQPIIADSDRDGVADANGFWANGDHYLAIPTKYSNSVLAGVTNPAAVLEQFLLYIGVTSGEIDSTSFTAAAAIFTAQGVSFSGGWTRQISRQKALADILLQCGGIIDVRDKVYLRVRSKTPVATITAADIVRSSDKRSSFTYTPANPKQNDSGHLLMSVSTVPADVVTKILVTCDTTTTLPVSQPISMPLVHDTVVAQGLARLHFQRLLNVIAAPTWKQRLTTGLVLQPEDVLTISSSDYAGTYTVLVDEVFHERSGTVKINALRYSTPFEDLGDYTGFSAVVPPAFDNSGAWKLSEDQMLAATQNVEDIVADNLFDVTEMMQCRQAWEAIVADRNGLDTQATALGLASEKNAYDIVFVELATYLNNGVPWVSGIPGWISDATIAAGLPITIVRDTFRTEWRTYDVARNTLLTAIAAAQNVGVTHAGSAHAPSNADHTATAIEAGVGTVLAGVGMDYRLRVDNLNAKITIAHKDANPGINIAAYTGAVRCGLYQAANGLALGYHSNDGVWHDAVAITSTGNIVNTGSLDTGDYVRATGVHLVGSNYAAIIGDVSVSNPTRIGVTGLSYLNAGMLGSSVSGPGVWGVTTAAGGLGVGIRGYAPYGAWAGIEGTGPVGVLGIPTTGGTAAVKGDSTVTGGSTIPAVWARSASGNAAYYGLKVEGYMTINSTIKVVNLNAEYLDGKKLSSSGDRFDVIPFIGSDGGMEIGTYLDFHGTDADTGDYRTRIYSPEAQKLTIGNGTTTMFLDGDAADRLVLGAYARILQITVYSSFCRSLIISQIASGAQNTFSTNSQLTHHASHDEAASVYKQGSVPTLGTAPFLYFNIGGKVCGYVDAMGVYRTA